MRVLLLVLILLFGLVGVAGSALVGYAWQDVAVKDRKTIDTIRNNAMFLPLLLGKTLSEEELHALRRMDLQIKGIPFMYAGAAIGLLGCVLAYLGRGISGGILLMTVGAGPAVLSLKAAAFTGAMILAGLLALFRKPKQKPQPVEA